MREGEREDNGRGEGSVWNSSAHYTLQYSSEGSGTMVGRPLCKEKCADWCKRSGRHALYA